MHRFDLIGALPPSPMYAQASLHRPSLSMHRIILRTWKVDGTKWIDFHSKTSTGLTLKGKFSLVAYKVLHSSIRCSIEAIIIVEFKEVERVRDKMDC